MYFETGNYVSRFSSSFPQKNCLPFYSQNSSKINFFFQNNSFTKQKGNDSEAKRKNKTSETTDKSSKKFGSEGLYSSHNATRAASERERVIMADDKVPERFELLEQTIEQFVETTRQIGIIVSDFQPGSQGVLNQKM